MGLMSAGGGSNSVGTIAIFFQWEAYNTIRGDFAPSIFSSGQIQNYSYNLTVAKDCSIQFHFLRNNGNGFWLTAKVNSESAVIINEGYTVSLKKGDRFWILYGH